MTAGSATFLAFGLAVRKASADGPDLGVTDPRGAYPGAADVALEFTSEEAIDAAASRDSPPVWRSRFPDGCLVEARSDDAGGYRIDYGRSAAFHLPSPGDRIRCAPADRGAVDWKRFCADTIMWWTALMHGTQLIHAGVVEHPLGLLAFLAPSGGGKSSLVADFVEHGSRLFSDDLLALDADGGGLCHPGPGLMNLADDALIRPGGPTVARFPETGESWIVPERLSTAPQRATALIVLDRRPGSVLAVEPLDVTVLDLLPHAWGLPDRPDDAAARFAVLADLASSAPMYHLRADTDVPPRTLAMTVEQALAPDSGRSAGD